MSLTDPRFVFRPLEYPEAEQYTMRQQQAHWLHTEVAMASDMHDWARNLSDAERTAVGNVLKGFTQTEVIVGEYWGRRVPCWFPKPEIAIMGSTFASFEGIHTMAYAHLNTTLGIDAFDAFLSEPTAAARIDNIVDVPVGADLRSVATSLAVYSGFVEGVSLFSAFGLLLSFSMRNLLKGVGQIVSWSIRDESLHSEAGCWLFRTLCAENPGLRDQVHADVVEATAAVVALEHDFIDACLADGPVGGVRPADLKAMINHRANTKLGTDLGFGARSARWPVDVGALERMSWFDALGRGVEHQDFFAQRPTAYARGTVDWASAW